MRLLNLDLAEHFRFREVEDAVVEMVRDAAGEGN